MTSLTEPIKIKERQKIAKLIISNKKVKSLKDTKKNNKRFGEMDKVFGMYDCKK